MIQFIRRFFASKLGVGITLAFLALIALAFASSDVANTSTFGGVSGGDRVAIVGDERISTSDLSRAASQAVDRLRERDPTISLQAFVRQGGLDEVLDQLVDRAAIAGYARKHGLRAGDNLVNSEIVAIPAFRGPDGNFNAEFYRAALARQGLNDAIFRREIAESLLARQLLEPTTSNSVAPEKFAQRYAALLMERRKGSIALIPAQLFQPKDDPSDKQIEEFYKAERARYVRPERRVIRYAIFGTDALDSKVEPTEEELRAAFEADKEKYGAKETRRITQFVVPTEAAAKAIVEAVRNGKTLEQAAREASFRTSSVGPVSRAELAQDASDAVAEAVFKTPKGAIAPPQRSPLGWYVARVDDIRRVPARSFESVKEDIRKTLREQKRARALADLTARVEEELDEGVSLSQIAEELGVTVQTTEPLTADGRVYGKPQQSAPAELQRALGTAFQMEEGEPQLAELERGSRYLVFEASEITPSATAPLKEIRDQVIEDWRRAQGAKKAREAADALLERIAKGTPLGEAIREEKLKIPPPQSINLTRRELAERTQGRVPAPLALMFSMAQGTAKKLEAPEDIGWFLVVLDRIETDQIDANDPMLASVRQQFGPTLGGEYAAQLRDAIRAEMGVELNPDAIAAVRRQLLGEN